YKVTGVQTCALPIFMGKRPVLFRPPYGQLDGYGEQAIRARNLELVLWSVAADELHEEQAMFESLRDQIQYAGGGSVLMHDTRPEDRKSVVQGKSCAP